jgi:hypothetical protein
MSTEQQVAVGFLARLKSAKPKIEQVETKAFGIIYLRRPNGTDSMKISALRQEMGAQGLTTVPKAVLGAVFGSVLLLNENGSPQFETPEKGFAELCEAGSNELSELWDAIAKVAYDTPTALEDAEKKSSSDQTSDSGTN